MGSSTMFSKSLQGSWQYLDKCFKCPSRLCACPNTFTQPWFGVEGEQKHTTIYERVEELHF